MQIKRTIKRTIGMCVSPAIEVVTIKARHMDAKRTIVLLRWALNTALHILKQTIGELPVERI